MSRADGSRSGGFGVVGSAARRIGSPLEPLAAQDERPAGAPGHGEGCFRTLLETNVVGLVVVGADGAIPEANDTLLAMLGYTRENLPLRWESLASSDSRLLETADGETARPRGAALPWETELVARDGRRVPVLIEVVREGSRGDRMGIVIDLSGRRKSEKRLLNQRRGLRALGFALARAEESERRRIATGLHDDIGQTLAAAKLQLGGLAQSERPRQAVEQVIGLLNHALQATRSLSFDLSSPVLYELGLEAALKSLGEKLSRETGIVFTFEPERPNSALEADLSIVLYRIARELLHNIAKHAGARHVSISFQQTRHELCLSVEDDGEGFDVRGAGCRPSAKGGMGLFLITQKLEHLGGSLRLESRPGGGARVVTTLPLHSPNGAAR